MVIVLYYFEVVQKWPSPQRFRRGVGDILVVVDNFRTRDGMERQNNE